MAVFIRAPSGEYGRFATEYMIEQRDSRPASLYRRPGNEDGNRLTGDWQAVPAVEVLPINIEAVARALGVPRALALGSSADAPININVRRSMPARWNVRVWRVGGCGTDLRVSDSRGRCPVRLTEDGHLEVYDDGRLVSGFAPGAWREFGVKSECAGARDDGA